MADRLTKKELRQDKFLQGIYEAWAYAQDNIPVVIAGVVGVIALVVIGFRVGGAAVGGSPAGNPEAERALSGARSLFFGGQPDAGIQSLRDLVQRHGNSRAGKEGQYLLANALYENGDYASALQAFETFLRDPLHDDLMVDAAKLAIAACREEAGDLAGASADYQALWGSALSPGSRLQAGLGAARCAQAQGQLTQAAQFYEQVANEYPNSPEAEDARFRLLELRG